MRRKINNELKEYLLIFAGEYTIDELLPKVNKIFNENYTRLELQKYLWRNRIEYKYQNENKKRNNVHNKPIGSERIKDGLVQVKVANNKWEYKQRIIYEKYYNVKLKSTDYIIFLDGDRNNFNINNLEKVSYDEAGYIGAFKVNNNLIIKDKEITKTLLSMAKINNKLKEIK